MSFSFIASAQAQNSASGTSLATGSTLNVAAGDVLVVWMGWFGGVSTMAVSDGGSNIFTMESATVNSVYGCFGYILIASANASATFTATWGTARTWRAIKVMQFRPDSGETVSKDTSNTGTGGSAAPQSGNITTTGIDEIVLGGGFGLNMSSFSSMEIGDIAADGSITNYTSMWYRLLTATASNIHSQATTGSTNWICNIIAFKSVAAGGISIPIVMQQMNQFNGGQPIL